MCNMIAFDREFGTLEEKKAYILKAGNIRERHISANEELVLGIPDRPEWHAWVYGAARNPIHLCKSP